MKQHLLCKALPSGLRSAMPVFAASVAVLSFVNASDAQPVSAGSDKGRVAAAGARSTQDHSFDDYGTIAATLQKYLDAARIGDGASQRAIWYDHAHVVGSEDGKFYNDDANGFAKDVSQGGPAPQIVARIADIAVSGPAASARIEIQGWNGYRYTDFFVLYKHDGVWKVSGKVFDSHDRN